MDAEIDRLFQAFMEPDQDRPCCGDCGQPIEFWTEFAESTSAGVVHPLVIHHIVNQGTHQPHKCPSQGGQ